MLMRRGEVMEALGVSKEKVNSMIACGVLRPVYLAKDHKGRPTGQARFCRREVEGIGKTKLEN
jgi:hypothetical protein